MAKQVIGHQGEVRIVRIDAIPVCAQTKPAARCEKGFIISHSESGHHHIVTGGDVMERTNDVPPGMQVFYAQLHEKEEFVQDASVPHGKFELPPGFYEFRVSREFDPFSEQSRRVAD